MAPTQTDSWPMPRVKEAAHLALGVGLGRGFFDAADDHHLPIELFEDRRPLRPIAVGTLVGQPPGPGRAVSKPKPRPEAEASAGAAGEAAAGRGCVSIFRTIPEVGRRLKVMLQHCAPARRGRRAT